MTKAAPTLGSRDAAFTALKDASDSRHMKLHDLPAAVAASVSKDAAVNTRFENQERHLCATVSAGGAGKRGSCMQVPGRRCRARSAGYRCCSAAERRGRTDSKFAY
jgi:hypothetical protein